MKKLLLSIMLIGVVSSAYSTKWTVTNSGNTFSPATITINVGDSVFFNLGVYHNVVEVSENTWNTNGNYPIPGFSAPYGGGLILPSKLAVGTHYYVCTPHAVLGMKGIIVVQNVTGIADNKLQKNFKLYPNPTNGKFQIALSELHTDRKCELEIYNVKGERIYKSPITSAKSEIDITNQKSGIYFIKFYDGLSVHTERIVVK